MYAELCYIMTYKTNRNDKNRKLVCAGGGGGYANATGTPQQNLNIEILFHK